MLIQAPGENASASRQIRIHPIYHEQVLREFRPFDHIPLPRLVTGWMRVTENLASKWMQQDR